MPDALTFASELLSRGIELLIRNGRLHVWPGKARKHLSDAERTFIREHNDELKALAASKALPETTVEWQPPTVAATPTATESAPTTSAAWCPYCARPVCVGPEHWAYASLHFHDPAEVTRRANEATAVMLNRIRCGNPY
jgi:hypothetical protein